MPIVKPTAKYRFSTKRGIGPSRPVVHGDRCFFKATPRELVSYKVTDGTEVWRRPSENFIPRAAVGEAIVMGGPQRVRAISLDGAELCTFDAPLSSWTLWNQALVLPGNPLRLARTDTGEVTQLVNLPFAVWGGFMAAERYVGFQYPDRRFLCCDLSDGSVLWESDLFPKMNAITPTGESDGFMFASGPSPAFMLVRRDVLFAFSVADASLLWHQPVKTSLAPAMTADRVYLWSRRDDETTAHLLALDALTGAVIYDRPLSQYGKVFDQTHETHSPTVTADAVLISTRQGLLCAFSPADGALLWRYKHHEFLSAPTISGNSVLVTAGDGQLLIFDLMPRRPN